MTTIARISLRLTCLVSVLLAPPALASPLACTPDPAPPFTQCPHVGLDTGCAILLVLEADQDIRVIRDPSQPPYDGSDEVLIGVQNNRTDAVASITVGALDALIFDFAFGGICAATPAPGGCPFGPTGFEGPGVNFSNINAATTSGTVEFAGGLQPGESTYFGLADLVPTSCPPIANVPSLRQDDSQWRCETYGELSASELAPQPRCVGGPNDRQPCADDAACPGGFCCTKKHTIGRWGCTLTSEAMIVNYHAAAQGLSFSTNPKLLNDWLRSNRGFQNGDQVEHLAVARYARENGVSLYYHQPTGSLVNRRNDFVLDQHLCEDSPVVLRVVGNTQHFVVATGQTTISGSSTYAIRDPGHAHTTLAPYACDFKGMRPFRSTAAPKAALSVRAYSPVELLLTDPQSRSTGRTTTAGPTQDEIPRSSYSVESIGDDEDPGSGLSTSEVKEVLVLGPQLGTYALRATGTGTGPFTIEIVSLDPAENDERVIYHGVAAPGVEQRWEVRYGTGTPGDPLLTVTSVCLNAGDACDDGNACSVPDTCAGPGECVTGPPRDCADGNACTEEACDAEVGCLQSPVDCDDSLTCTGDSCDPGRGCVNAPLDAIACEDGNACSTADSCVAGVCLGGPALVCDDGEPCTDDTCLPESGCSRAHNTAACDDGNACSAGDTCSQGKCGGFADALALTAGDYHTCALRDDGRIDCWGYDAEGSVSGPNASTDLYTAIDAGAEYTCALRTDGRLACWGYDSDGQVAAANASTDAYAAVSAGNYHVCALSPAGQLTCWGLDDYGEVAGPNASTDTYLDVSAGDRLTCARRTDDRLICWGDDGYGQVAGPNASTERYREVSAGSGHVCAVRSDGRLACWGEDDYGQVAGPDGDAGPWRGVAAGDAHTCAVAADLDVRCWGEDFSGTVSSVNASTGAHLAVVVGEEHVCAMAFDGGLDCWGFDSAGQVVGPNGAGAGHTAINADGSQTCVIRAGGDLDCWGDNSRGQVSGPNDSSGVYTEIDSGYVHTCALRQDGGLDCFGFDDNGRVDGPNASTGPFSRVSAGWEQTCALRTGGRLACWGDDSYGQVAGPNGSTETYSAIASGGMHTCALRADGRLACWGLDNHGQIAGPNASTDSYTALDAGGLQTCAIRSDARVRCWGDDWTGQVSGPNASTGSFVAVSADLYHTCALGTDGRLACWGYDAGESVSGPNADTASYLAVGTGYFHTCALTLDGTPVCWGDDGYGNVNGPDLSAGRFGFAEGLDCDDQEPCTLDSCGHVDGCEHEPLAGTCDDGNPCTADESCVAGACTGISLVTPPEVTGLRFTGPASLVWNSALGAGPGTVHDVPRGRVDQLPVGTGGAEGCAAWGITDATIVDTDVPPAGRAFWFLVRGRNACGVGSYGNTTSGAERITVACP